MSYGILTKDAAGAFLLHSPSINGVFHKNTGIYSSSVVNIPVDGFPTSFGISTPLAPVTFHKNLITDHFSLGGSVASGGLNYYPPSARVLTKTNLEWPYPVITANATFVHTFGVPPTFGNYGFMARGANAGQLAISDAYRVYTVHPNSAGSKIRTGTASSLVVPSSFGEATFSTYTQNIDANIIFDKPYNQPPLIFITASSGMIAMNYMLRDANGLFIGASIVAAATFVDEGVKGVGAYQSNTYSFSYFIVSDEVPVYVPTENYGMRVFNASGGKVFDSGSFVPNFYAVSVVSPYLTIEANRTFANYHSVAFSRSANQGVCINNIHSISGVATYTSYSVPGGKGGPLTFMGRFMNVSSSTYSAFYGYAAGSIMVQYPEEVGSYDFHTNSNTMMDVFFASYQL